MDILYCSRCNRVIPPGGLDEGRYFKLGEELICPKCYYKAKPGEHSGDTVPIEPIKDDRLLGAGRITPAEREDTPRHPTTRVGQAAKPRKSTSTRVMLAVSKPPTSRLMPAAPRGRAGASSARLRAAGGSSAMVRLALAAVVLVVIVVVAALLLKRFHVESPGPAPGGQPPAVGDQRQPESPGIGPGAGTGLRGEYFDGGNFETSRLTRVDPKVDFKWPASPGKGVKADHFSVRWTGQVEAERSETYTFYTLSDDGVRLWVDERKLIDDWKSHAATENKGSVALQAGRRYDLRLEFFDDVSMAQIQLFWSSPSTPRQIVPTRRLYPAPESGPAPASLARGLIGHWQFDEKGGDVAKDASGAGRDGKLNGGLPRMSVAAGWALEFDGGNRCFTAGGLAVNAAPGGKNTVAFWMKWAGQDQQMPFTWTGRYDLLFHQDSFGFNTGEGNVLGVASAGLNGKWVHVAAVFVNGVPDAAGCRLYLDGRPGELTWRHKGSGLSARSAANSVRLSGWEMPGTQTYAFRGLIRDLRIYDRELLADEVDALAKGG
jgi:hypothetical protein